MRPLASAKLASTASLREAMELSNSVATHSTDVTHDSNREIMACIVKATVPI
jgi:hypothetical protein